MKLNNSTIKACLLLLLSVVTSLYSVNAQEPNWGNKDRWESLNPGGGGQIQDVYFDKNVEGRIWFSSDMEGIYRSNDYGKSWDFVSNDLSHGMAFVLAQEEGGNRMYQGGLYGAHVCTNSGASDYHDVTWDMIDITRGDAIASIAVSKNKQTVVLAPGWQNKDPQKGEGALCDPIQNLTSDKFNGERIIYLSKDRGQTFSKVKYTNTNGYRNVFGVAIHPTNNNIYIGSAAGVFVSTNGGTSFSQISKPAEALNGAGNAASIKSRPDGGSRGVGLSPDGKYIYATYQTKGGADYGSKRWAVFVAKTSANGITGGWTKIMSGLPDTAEWYDPKVDPRSTGTKHRVLVGTVWNNNKNRIGLWEATVNFDGSGNLNNHSWQQVLNLPKSGRCYDFEPSWEHRDFIVRTYDYTPKSWSTHKIISMGGMNVFLSDATGSDFPCSGWEEVYSKVIYYHQGKPMGRERGFSSPYCYDVDSYKNYMVQGCADHGMLQSLDNGYSWTSEFGPQGVTNVMSVLTVPTNPALVLIDTRKGYGAPSQSVGGLYAKQINLTALGQTADWKLIGGAVPNTTGITKGLPSRNYRAMSYDPILKKRVYVSMRGKNWGGANIEGGVYVADDIVSVFNGNGTWRKISNADMAYKDIRDIWADPKNSNYVYARSAGSGGAATLYRGVRQGNGSYSWTTMSDCKSASDMYVWVKGGQTWLVVAGNVNNKYGIHICKDPRNANWNDKDNWEFSGFDIAKSLQLKPEKWIEPSDNISISGLAAHGDIIIATTAVTKHKKGLGAFQGEIKSNGTIEWKDWSIAPGNNRRLENPTSLQAKVRVEDGKNNYYVALAGTGPWRRQITPAKPPCITVSTASVNFTASSGNTTASVTTSQSWSVSDNAGWITATKSGSNINISVSANNGTERTGTVTVNGCENRTITVTQAAAPSDCTFSISKTSHSFDANAGSTTVNVNTNEEFTVSDNTGWISATKNGNIVTISVTANGTTNNRNGKVTITGCDVGEVAISQASSGSGGGSGDTFNETFDNLPTLNQWSNGSFVGDEATWSYTQVKRTSTINGNTIKLDNSANASVRANLTNGLTKVSVKASPTGTGSSSGVKILVNNSVVGQFTIAKGSASQTFTVDNLDITGAYELKFQGFNNSDVQLDDISWTSQGSSNSPETYNLTVNSGSGDGVYEAGEAITITADAAPSGKEFDKWTGGVSNVANVNNATTSLTMPANGVTVTATYKSIPVSGGGSETFGNLPTLNQWSNGSFTGDEGFNWSYTQVKRTSTINGNTIKLDNSANASVRANISGGLMSVTFKAAPTGTGSNSGVEVFVAGVSKAKFDIAKGSAPKTFTVNNINASGTVELKFKGYNSSDVQIDDISWTTGSAARVTSIIDRELSVIEVSIYPNPVLNTLNIKTDRVVNVHIMNALGQLVLSHNTSNTNQVDVSKLQKGIYFVKVEDKVIRMVKQ